MYLIVYNQNLKKFHTKFQMVKLCNILNNYQINEKEISEIKKKFKKINLNKLNVDNKIEFIIDQSQNKIKEFTFQISSTEKIILTRKIGAKDLIKKLSYELQKEILYKEI